MRTSSLKAKSRRLQNFVAGIFMYYGKRLFGLRIGDIEPRPMGQGGVDIIFSPDASEKFPFDIECKNVEKLNIVAVFNTHRRNYERTGRYPLLIHSRNDSEVLVTMSFQHLMGLLYAIPTIKGFDLCIKHKNSWDAIKKAIEEDETC